MSNFRQRKLARRLEPTASSLPASRVEHDNRRRETAGAWLSILFVFIVLTICIAPNIFQSITVPRAGTPWPYNEVVTPYAISIPDTIQADIQKRRLQANHQKVFIVTPTTDRNIQQRIDKLVAYLAEADETSSTAVIAHHLRGEHGINLKPETIAALTDVAPLSRTAQDLRTIFHHLLSVRGISADKSLLLAALRSERAHIISPQSSSHTSQTLRMVLTYPDEAFNYTENTYLQAFRVAPEVKAAYADIVRQLLKPNINFDAQKTDERLEEALAAIQPQKVYEPGTTVIRPGQTATTDDVAALTLLAQREQQNDFLRLIGGSIVVLMAITFTGLYARRFNHHMHFNPRTVLMVALPVVLAVSLGRVIINLGGGMLLGGFAMPAGMVGILTMMLFDERFAIVLTTMACGLFAVATGLSFPYMLIGVVGGYTAIASLRNLSERREVLYTGLYIALANCLIALAIGLVMNPARPELGAGMVAAVVNGFVCYMLAVAALPVFENIFQVTTDVRLLELTGGNHKLLQIMEEKAPGSLHHSMNVASLAEAAAEAVNAHYLLVRAGAYFHDIGKMLKPTYFTENQTTPEQKLVHTRLSPAMSTLIIKNHVKEGIELARQYRLPERVIEFIPEHHGTTLIKYFYVQALKKAEQDGSDEIISEDEYRYPGPKPRSVETAILMLADSVEAIATSRFAGRQPDETEIRRAVHEAVNEKYEDRQLSNSPLTFRDLEVIKDAFVRVLQNRFHQRIKYPSMPPKTGQGTGSAQSQAHAEASKPPLAPTTRKPATSV